MNMQYKTSGRRVKRITRRLLFGLVAVTLVLILGLIINVLWNSLMPSIAHVTQISYLQALGLFVLSRLLFGRFQFGPRGNHRFQGNRSQMWSSKMASMTDAERAAFKAQWKERCEKKQAGSGPL